MSNTQVVILGIPRSGTSMVAHICRLLGAYMGDIYHPQAQDNPGGSLEDEEARAITHGITRGRHMPLPGLNMRDDQHDAMRAFIDKRNAAHPVWGWKDCHTGWIAWQWEQHLENPHYIWVQRDPGTVLMSWIETWSYYPLLAYQRITTWQAAHERFLAGRPHLDVWYEELTAYKGVESIAGYIGLDGADMTLAKNWIQGGK